MALIAHWPLDGRLDDVSGNGHALNTVNIVNDLESITMNGSSSNVYTTDEFTLNGRMSISIWFKIASDLVEDGSIKSIIYFGLNTAKENQPLNLYYLSGKLSVTSYFNRTAGEMFDICEVDKNVWYNLILNKNRNSIDFFLNGTYINTWKLINDFDTKTYPLCVGMTSVSTSANRIFKGSIMGVKLTNHMLTYSDIQGIVKRKILHFKFNEMVHSQYNDAISQDEIIARGGITFSNKGKSKDWNYLNISGTTSTGDGRKGVFRIPVTTSAPPEEKYSIGVDFRIIGDNMDNYYIQVVSNNMSGDPHYAPTRIEGDRYLFENLTIVNTFDICLYSNVDDYVIPDNVQILWRHIQLEPFPTCSPYVEKNKTRSHVIDSSDYRNHGSLGGMRYLPPVHSEANKSLTFYNDGSTNTKNKINTSVKLNTEIMNLSDFEITVLCKVRTANTQGYGSFIGSVYYNGIGIIVLNEKYCGFIRTDTQDIRLFAPGVQVNDNLFHTVAITFSRLTGLFTFYIDGNYVTRTVTSIFTNSMDNRNFNIMGCVETGGVGPWLSGDIEIADVQVYRTALSKEDIDLAFSNKTEISKFGSIKSKYLVNRNENLVDLNPPSYSIGLDSSSFKMLSSVENSILLRGNSGDSYSPRYILNSPIHSGDEVYIEFDTIKSDNIISDVRIEVFIFEKVHTDNGKRFEVNHAVAEPDIKHHSLFFTANTASSFECFRVDVNSKDSTILFRNIKIYKNKKPVNLAIGKTGLDKDFILERKALPQTNLIDYLCWKTNTVGDMRYFRANITNLTVDDYKRMIKLNPWNKFDIVWASEFNDEIGDGDGGYHTATVVNKILDPIKKYRYSCWVRRENMGDGRCHFGPRGSLINMSDNTQTDNPYFMLPVPSSYGESVEGLWTLMVFYILPFETTVDDPRKGLYKLDGTRIVVSGDNFRFSSLGKINLQTLSYLYYSTSVNERCYWYRPRVDLCDGTEPTIDDLLNGREHGSIIEALGKFNPMFPPDEQFIEIKRAHGARWGKIFYHNNNAGTIFFSNDPNEFLKCDAKDKKSILHALPYMRDKDYKFEFLLEYDSFEGYNRWKQTSVFTEETIAGYEEIKVSWKSNSWGGLEPTTNIATTYVDGSVGVSDFWFSLGHKSSYSGGIPAFGGQVETAGVHLWVRLPEVAWFTQDNELVVNEIEPI